MLGNSDPLARRLLYFKLSSPEAFSGSNGFSAPSGNNSSRSYAMTMQLEHSVDSLNSLLRGELSAIESYETALSRFVGIPQEGTLHQILAEHVMAAESLHEHVVEHGGEPTAGSGPWGYFTAAVTDSNHLLELGTTLAALKRGEEHGCRKYDEATMNDDLPEECRSLISNRLRPNTRMHVLSLERLLASSR
jgi:hypothetical protein